MEQLIDAFLDHLTVERGLASNTRLAYRADLAQFADFLHRRGVEHLNDAQRQVITEYLLHRRKGGLSARSLSRHLAAIRTFCRFLSREKLLAADPTQTIDSPRLWRTLPHSLDYEEVGRLLAAPDPRTRLGVRDRAMLEFMYATGLRVSEVAQIKLSDINFEAGFLRSLGKGSKERIVPIGKQAIDWMQRYLHETRGSFAGANSVGEVFLSTRGQPLSRKTIWVLIKKYARTGGHFQKHHAAHATAQLCQPPPR